jgi:hypothetical protein
MNRFDDRYSRHDRERDEWRGGEGGRRGFGQDDEQDPRESFHPGNYGFQEGESSGRTAGDTEHQPFSQNPYGYYPGQGPGQGRQRGEWRGRESQPYGQREPYNTSGSRGQYGGRSRWEGQQSGSRYSESQYGMPRGGREYGSGYGRGGYGAGSESSMGDWRRPGRSAYGPDVDTRYGSERGFGEGPFADTAEPPGFFGTGYYGDGGASYGGGFDQRSRSRGYGSFSEDTMRSSGRSSWGARGSEQPRYRTGPKGYTRSDERLREDISERLMMADSIDSSEVTVTVKDCLVTLEGTVPNRYMKHSIEDLVDSAPGVQDIDNRIRVERGESRSGASQSTSGTSGGQRSSTSQAGSTQSGASTGTGSTSSGSSGLSGTSGTTSNGGKTRNS